MATTSWSTNSEGQPPEYEANAFHDEQSFWLPCNVPHDLALMSDSVRPISTSRELFLPDDMPWLPGAVNLANSNNHEAGKSMHFSPLSSHDYVDHSLDGQLIEPVFSPSPRKELLLQCNFADCAGQQFFTQRSAFKRHMDRHERPFICLEQSCNKRAFPDKGTLRRHQHSVHSRPHIYCPLKSCRRHTKGFARKDNLREHMKRAHPTELLQTNPSIQRYDSPPDISAGNETRRGSLSDVSHEDGSVGEAVARPTGTGSMEVQVLAATLQELKAERARRLKELDLESLDSDIMAVERTLKLVTPSPSLT